MQCYREKPLPTVYDHTVFVALIMVDRAGPRAGAGRRPKLGNDSRKLRNRKNECPIQDLLYLKSIIEILYKIKN